MRTPRPLLAALALAPLVASGCLAGFALPPTRTEIGPALLLAGGGGGSGAGSGSGAGANLRFDTGVHLASARLDGDSPVDLGVGYSFETLQRELPVTPLGHHRVGVHGAYLEAQASLRLGDTDWSRAWLGARTELLVGDVGGETRFGLGISGRLSWEAFTTRRRAAPFHSDAILLGGGYRSYGASSVGFYLEAGYQLLPHGDGAALITVGLTFRLPAFAVGVGVVPLPI